jgi:hypothetical protein
MNYKGIKLTTKQSIYGCRECISRDNSIPTYSSICITHDYMKEHYNLDCCNSSFVFVKKPITEILNEL